MGVFGFELRCQGVEGFEEIVSGGVEHAEVVEWASAAEMFAWGQ